MPFVQGKKPALTLPDASALVALTEALHAAGYTLHGGLKVVRRGELLTFRNRYLADGKAEQQNHVQVVAMPEGNVGVFAHTEPYGMGLRHFISAVCDNANYGAGAAMLKRHLRDQGFLAGK